MKHIDPHVHCRDGREAYKTTIGKVARLAQKQEIVAIFDMPNTNPPILREKDVTGRLKLAKRRRPQIKYFLYVGLTADEKQVREAIEIVKNFPEVIGPKLYLSGSELKVTRETDQENIFRILSEMDYRGVLPVHCQKEGFFNPRLFNPEEPWTWGLAWPPEAETEAVRDQIKFAKEAKFKGNLHICHITLPESVDLVWQAKKEINISCGVTPHHLLFSEDTIKKSKSGLLYKVNPPLRSQRDVEELLDRLRERKIDWIETDYAPHLREEKLYPPYLSGINSLRLYQKCLFWLSVRGLTWLDIQDLTYWNIKKVFGDKLKGV